MANMLDYISWRGDISFDERPFNEVDCLVLSQIIYLNFSGIVPSEFGSRGLRLCEVSTKFRLAGDYTDRADIGAVINPLTLDLLQAAGQSRRFGDIVVSGFVSRLDEQREEQFAAACFTFTTGIHVYNRRNCNVVIFRGTDDSLVGWKEDFNLGYKDTVPSQEDALGYLEAAARVLPGDIVAGGHSKGGNLALYACVNADRSVKKRIVAVYNNDGPGFSPEFFSGEGYLEIASREHSFFPEMSVVGMLFSHSDAYRTVECDQRGLMQHDPFAWHVSPSHFVELDDVSGESRFIGKTVNQWIQALSSGQREQFVDTLFAVLRKSEAQTNSDLAANKFESVMRIIKAAGKLDPETRDAVFKTVQLLFKQAYDNRGELRKR